MRPQRATVCYRFWAEHITTKIKRGQAVTATGTQIRCHNAFEHALAWTIKFTFLPFTLL